MTVLMICVASCQANDGAKSRSEDVNVGRG